MSVLKRLAFALTLAACLIRAAPAATVNPASASTQVDGEPAPPGAVVLQDGLWLASRESVDKGDSPRYTQETRLPYLGGRRSPAVIGFNQGIQDLMSLDIWTFRTNVTELRFSQPEGPGSFQSVGYTVSTANRAVISLFIGVGGYIEGAAHPYHYDRAFNYDLTSARTLTLSDLFSPGAEYLPRLADLTVAKFAPLLGDAFFSDGAEPREDNYDNWNVQADGLLIRFNEYQIGPYAAGPQMILVPYLALDDILRRDARLAAVRGQ